MRLAVAAVVVPLILPPKNSLPYRLPLHLIPGVGVSNDNYTVGFLLKFYLFFSGHSSMPTILSLV
jgi:hypothetical protein